MSTIARDSDDLSIIASSSGPALGTRCTIQLHESVLPVVEVIEVEMLRVFKRALVVEILSIAAQEAVGARIPVWEEDIQA